MKLKNKKTGEIIEVESLDVDSPTEGIVGIPSFDRKGSYNSLAELNEEWEDYEYPEEYWYIDYDGGILCGESDDSSAEKMMISIGNHFDSLEEAEKAVEKLKAWKRLKDKGIINGNVFTMNLNWCKPDDDDWNDYQLLFGGEE